MAMRLSGLASGMDTDLMVSELMKAHRLKSTKIQNKITTLEWTQDKWKDLNSKIYALYTGPLSKLRMQGSFQTKKASSSDDSRATITASAGAVVGNHTLKIKQLASAQFETGDKLGLDKNQQKITGSTKLIDLGMNADAGNQIIIDAVKGVKTFTITESTTVDDFVKALRDAGLNASFDTTQNRFFISSKESGSANAFSIQTNGNVNLSLLGLAAISKTDNGDGTFTVTGGKNLVAPKDAHVIYNGAEIKSSTNTITANGLTITLKSVTAGANTADTADDVDLNINVTDDTKAVYDMIKDFVKSYNELIKEMNELFYAASAKGFEPLTDEQRESMTDDQIEKWEKKIKDSLLRRDENLNTVLDTMRTNLSKSVNVNGKNFGLASFGIASTNYTEKGLLHIDGDEDDSMVSAKTNLLMKALTEDPDTVMKVFNEVADSLYSDLTEKMRSTSLRSALTLYNDKDMAKQITKYKKDLSTMETKLKKMEDKYYKQFAAMEAAMSKLNSQSSSLASMLGMNTQ